MSLTGVAHNVYELAAPLARSLPARELMAKLERESRENIERLQSVWN